MKRRSNNLIALVIELERLLRPKGGRFFMIWGIDNADLARKLSNARAEGDLQPGDKFDTKIWTYFSAPPPPRWISLDEMTDEELAIIAGGENREAQHIHPSIASQLSDGELSEVYADRLRCLA